MTWNGRALIVRGAELLPDTTSLDDLLRSRRRLRVKIGMDPTTSSLHWGHALCLLQAAAFRNAGHEVVVLIGTFTATIGDPSGRSTGRRVLSANDALTNAKQLVQQARRLIGADDVRFVFNHEWLTNYPLTTLLSDLSAFTVPQILARPSFRDRLDETHPLGVNEMLYPFLQALDSVHLGCDVEIGGRDQTANFVLTRKMQKAHGQEPEIGCVLPLIPGTDGAEKMSASEGNAIPLDSHPEETYGRVMSIPDTALPRFSPLAQLLSMDFRDDWPRQLHPMDAKTELARRMISLTHDELAASTAQRSFDIRFRKREIPSDLPEVSLVGVAQSLALSSAVVAAGLASSGSEARRLIEQGAIRVDGEKVSDSSKSIPNNVTVILSRGRRQHVKLHLTV